MFDDKTALGRVPVPFQSPAERADYSALLEASLSTPFVGQRKPWHIILIQDPATLEELGRSIPELICDSEEGPEWAVIICGDRRIKKRLGPLIADCYDATDSLLYAAHARSLNPQLSNLYPVSTDTERLRTLLQVPQHIMPFAIVSFGQRAGNAKRCLPDETRIHRESWA